jgi:hypothetical protein
MYTVDITTYCTSAFEEQKMAPLRKTLDVKKRTLNLAATVVDWKEIGLISMAQRGADH